MYFGPSKQNLVKILNFGQKPGRAQAFRTVSGLSLYSKSNLCWKDLYRVSTEVSLSFSLTFPWLFHDYLISFPDRYQIFSLTFPWFLANFHTSTGFKMKNCIITDWQGWIWDSETEGVLMCDFRNLNTRISTQISIWGVVMSIYIWNTYIQGYFFL